jgi:aspartate-semialdehyde dehydrogenase
VEPAFARAGKLVLSNAKVYRMEPDIPLVVPDVNSSHLDLLATQRETRSWSGAIVTNSNCAAAVAAMALGPLHEAFGVRGIFAATMQAVSGAGYPGVASLDILGNVIPFINDEEPKIEAELRKILGKLENGRVTEAPITVTAHANRVPVEHGHTVCMSVGFATKAKAADVEEVLRNWRGLEEVRAMPTAPELPLVISDRPDRPQPRRDVNAGKGMSAVVGRIRPDNILDVRLVVLGHNTVVGAAGASILNAELLATRGALAVEGVAG